MKVTLAVDELADMRVTWDQGGYIELVGAAQTLTVHGDPDEVADVLEEVIVRLRGASRDRSWG